MAKVRILLVDDHAVVREGLRALMTVQPDLDVVGEADDGRMAWELAKEFQPDIVVMDVSMPKLNGALATQQIKQNFPQIKVLALSAHEDKGYLQQFLEAGASGYVLKRAAADEFLRAIRMVAAGQVYLDPSMAREIVGLLFPPHSGREAASLSHLSGREAEVLHLIAEGYSNKEIAALLDLSVKTVETYKTRSQEKLGIHSRSEIVRYALQHGWLECVGDGQRRVLLSD